MKRKKLFLISLGISLGFSACHTPMPRGPVCLFYTDPGVFYCAKVGEPDNVWEFPPTDPQADQLVCRPAWYEKAMEEWIKRELARKR